MKCPNCNETLLMSEKRQIEIDYCPSCRGVWLDRGELEKMLEYATQSSSLDNAGWQHARPWPNDDQRGIKQPYKKPHRRKSFLGDLFDFD